MTFQLPLEKNAILDLDGYPGHKGLDFPVGTGSNVIASDSGTVVRASVNAGFGDVVIISHGNGLYTLYAHLSDYEVSLGDSVVQGQIIGLSGNSGGFTTGPHLHFSILQIPDHISISPTGSIFIYNKDYPAFFGLTDGEIVAKAGELGLAAPGTEGTYAIGVEFGATATGTTLDTEKLQLIAPSFVDSIPDDSSTPIHLLDDGSSDLWEFTGAIEYGQAIKDGAIGTETDWIKFSAVAGETYFIRVSGEGSDGIIELEDTLFTIRDPDNTDLRVGGTGDLSHDDVIGKDAAISWTPENSGDYFIAIGSGGSDFFHGGYKLTIKRTDGAPSGVFPDDGVPETISFADAAADFGVSDGSDVAELYLKSIFGSAISNVTYTGSESAAFLVSDFDIPGAGINLSGGILLSSGGFPGASNTEAGFTIEHGTDGDSDLFDVVRAAFPAAGSTQDASVLTFDIFVDDPDVDGIRFDIVFGSDEYPEFSNSSFVDVAAVWVDDDRDGNFEVDENKALFNGDPNTPLSVLDQNVALNFVDNESGTYATEWDGFAALSVRPALQQGWNSIKIAVADTGDQSLGSAIYVTNFEFLTGGATGDDVFKVVNGLVGQNDLEASETKEEFNLATGLGSVSGTLLGLKGDVITGFDTLKTLLFDSINFLREQLSVFSGSAILEVDSDRDGTSDSTVTLEGDFSGGDFMAVADGSNTAVTFETFLPILQEAQAIDPGLVNGIINQDFLKGDGSTDFRVTLRDMGFAGYDNVVGVYEIDASGNIVDTRILFENANADKSAVATVTDVEAGHKLGFFIVQDAADWVATIADGDTFSFVNSSGVTANISDGADIFIAVNGDVVDEMVFHSFAEEMNSDGVQHALSGVDVGGEAISVGFEDLTGGGDRDYEDVVFRVELVDDFLFV
ncbi:choice-of-anchor L domain-containing protein [Roseisalinus antarcticus]|uniref:Stage II sporulation protein Q n=1 Tax=Roseisalinus antarcticus TaxID=254357 RepID=A0A1Y5U0H3_9RHOB|nr:choice-of-anchor L domain-containing protein [Roseisalinus antarcticus]SLN77994.1 Stage II sporulation protein Q [Roseisalinus antarcticus]